MSDSYDQKLALLILSWHDWLVSEKSFSQYTGESYVIDLKYCLKFFTGYHSRICSYDVIAALTLNDFRAWLAYRHKQDYAFSSTARAIAAVKNFFKYLIKFHQFTNKAIFNLKSPKQGISLPKALNEVQTFAALEEIVNFPKDHWIALRDKAILALLYGCGLRISEALSLTLKDFNRETLLIKGKGQKERLIPLLTIVNQMVEQYIKSCPYNITKDDLVFVGKQGKALNPGVFQRHIRHVRRLLNLPESTTPHAFRHSFATHILINGGDLKSIQELLGHQDLATTQKYTTVDRKHLLDVYNRSHPHSNPKRD